MSAPSTSTDSSSPPSQSATPSSCSSSSSTQAAPALESIRSKRHRLSASSVHEEFTNVEVVDPKTNQKSSCKQCKHCGKRVTSTNPTNLKCHLRSNHKEVYLRVEGILNSRYINATFSTLSIFSNR